MSQQIISLLQNTTHPSTEKKNNTTKTQILTVTQSLEKGSLMSYLTTGSPCIYD